MTNIQKSSVLYVFYNIDELVQEKRNSFANALELRLSCTNPSLCIYCSGILFTNMV